MFSRDSIPLRRDGPLKDSGDKIMYSKRVVLLSYQGGELGRKTCLYNWFLLAIIAERQEDKCTKRHGIEKTQRITWHASMNPTVST